MTTRVRIAGDDLSETRLLAVPPGSVVEISPPPASWAGAKRLLYGFCARWCRGPSPRLRFIGVPRCVFGTEHRMLRSIPSSRAHPRCLGCRERARCSPPEIWSDELQPFGPLDPLERLRAHLSRLAPFVDADPERVVRAVEAMAVVTASARPGTPFLLEPSIELSPTPSATRVVVFFGDLPPGREADEHAISLERLRAAGLAFGAPLPAAVETLLTRHGPFPMPIGFEVQPSRLPLLKVYVRLERATPTARRALLADALRLVTPTPEDVAESADTEMVCVGLREGAVVQIKAYVARDARVGLPERGLAGLPEGHPVLALATEPRAYAVIDLYDDRGRPAKWDLRMRGTLSTGPVAAGTFGALVPDARPMLEEVLGAPDALVDVVAVASRAGTLTLYFELC
ncbi:MAG: hypothetical protein KF901_13015 [Myxococcales bacterium]|nr:hypothetical protein [Myxococcales bacterium]